MTKVWKKLRHGVLIGVVGLLAGFAVAAPAGADTARSVEDAASAPSAPVEATAVDTAYDFSAVTLVDSPPSQAETGQPGILARPGCNVGGPPSNHFYLSTFWGSNSCQRCNEMAWFYYNSGQYWTWCWDVSPVQAQLHLAHR